jgi:hypothetical protein
VLVARSTSCSPVALPLLARSVSRAAFMYRERGADGYVCVCIYISIEREREREKERGTDDTEVLPHFNRHYKRL